MGGAVLCGGLARGVAVCPTCCHFLGWQDDAADKEDTQDKQDDSSGGAVAGGEDGQSQKGGSG